MNKKRYAVLASAVIFSLGAVFNVMAADSVRTTTDPAITSRSFKNDPAEKEAARKVDFTNRLLAKNLGTEDVTAVKAPAAKALNIDLKGAVTTALNNNRDIRLSE